MADAGYHRLEQLAYIEEKGIDAVIADPRPEQRNSSEPIKLEAEEGIFYRGSFRYEKQSDEYTCPASERLSFFGTEIKRGRPIRIYRTHACVSCHLRTRCINSKDPTTLRRIARDEEEALAEAMLQRVRSPEGVQRLRLRATSVEPVFGNLKANLGFRRFQLRGLRNARGEFALMCIAHNLNKLYRLMGATFLDFLSALTSIWNALLNFELFFRAKISRSQKYDLPAS